MSPREKLETFERELEQVKVRERETWDAYIQAESLVKPKIEELSAEVNNLRSVWAIANHQMVALTIVITNLKSTAQ